MYSRTIMSYVGHLSEILEAAHLIQYLIIKSIVGYLNTPGLQKRPSVDVL